MTELVLAPRARDSSIDLLRGLVMCLMVLDHVRDFFTSTPFNPTDPDKTDLALFFTRFVTHYCAPVFVLLAGAGAGMSTARGRSAADSARFLLSRGLWLILLELTWVRFGWMFNLRYDFSGLQVIWALGCSMIALAGLVYLPRTLILLVGVAMIFGHNALDGVSAERFGAAGWIWKILHQGGRMEPLPSHVVRIVYPLVPWIGVMAIGFLFGQIWPRLDRRRLLAIGFTAIAMFVALRLSNLYGNPSVFVPRTGLRTLFAFLDVQKYPPSLDYLLVTLGPALVFLGILRGRSLAGPIGRTLVMFGRVPLFFYLLHLPLAHALSFPFRIQHGLPLLGGVFGHGLNVSLAVVYPMTLLTIAILWWPCARWAALKSARRDWWLSYL